LAVSGNVYASNLYGTLTGNIVGNSNVLGNLAVSGNVYASNLYGTLTGNIVGNSNVLGNLGLVNGDTFISNVLVGDLAVSGNVYASNLYGTLTGNIVGNSNVLGNLGLVNGDTFMSNVIVGDLAVSGNVFASVISKTLTGQATSYVASTSDYYIGFTNGGTVTLPLGTSLPAGKIFIIKDESGKAGSNQAFGVNIQMSGSDLLDGQSLTNVRLNYASLQIIWTGATNRWSFI
jgi:hypothetical protein